jgi:hypothetical protein
MQMRVLLIGHRRQLIDVFIQRRLDFFVWNDKPILDERVAELQYLALFSDDEKLIFQQLQLIKNRFGDFTHVIAGKEMAVIATVLAQRFFQVRIARQLDQVNLFRDKVLMKKKLKLHAVPMTEFFESLPDAYSFDVPLVFKERNSTGSRGIELIYTATQVQKSLSENFYFEKYIDGVEGSIESFVHDGEVIFTSTTKYLRKKYINLVGDKYASALQQKIQTLNHQVLAALELKHGMTHLEFYLLPNGDVLFGEIALRPPGGHIMELIERSFHFNAWQAYVDVELGMRPKFEAKVQEISLAYIFHPGRGVIESVPEKERVKQIAGVYKFKLKVKPGQLLAERNGVGEEAGYVLASLPMESDHTTIEGLIAQLDESTEIRLSHASASDHFSKEIR